MRSKPPPLIRRCWLGASRAGNAPLRGKAGGPAAPYDTDARDASSTASVPVNGTAAPLPASADMAHACASPDGAGVALHDGAGGGSGSVWAAYAPPPHAGLGALNGSRVAGDRTLAAVGCTGGGAGMPKEWTLGAACHPPGAATVIAYARGLRWL